jgi:hypothetical protein
MEECFTKSGRKDYLTFSAKETKPLLKEGTEIYVVALELETHQLVNMGRYEDAMFNLFTILKNNNLNNDIEKNTLFRIGAFYAQLFGDMENAEKYLQN